MGYVCRGKMAVLRFAHHLFVEALQNSSRFERAATEARSVPRRPQESRIAARPGVGPQCYPTVCSLPERNFASIGGGQKPRGNEEDSRGGSDKRRTSGSGQSKRCSDRASGLERRVGECTAQGGRARSAYPSLRASQAHLRPRCEAERDAGGDEVVRRMVRREYSPSGDSDRYARRSQGYQRNEIPGSYHILQFDLYIWHELEPKNHARYRIAVSLREGSSSAVSPARRWIRNA